MRIFDSYCKGIKRITRILRDYQECTVTHMCHVYEDDLKHNVNIFSVLFPILKKFPISL